MQPLLTLDRCETALSGLRSAADRVRPRDLQNVAIIIVLVVALGGCQAAQHFQTGDAGAARSIDPTYTIAPEEAAPARRDPDDVDLSPYLAEAAERAMRDGDSEAAAALLAELHTERPEDPEVAYDLARHLRYLGILDAAERTLQTALAANPEDPLLRLEFAKVLIADGRAESALLILEELRADRPSDPAILQANGIALDRLGRHAEAQRLYETAMSQGRASASLLNNAGMSHLIAGEVETAIVLLRRATVAPGAGPQVSQNLATALMLAGREDEARRVAESALPNGAGDRALDAVGAIPTTADAWSLAGES